MIGIFKRCEQGRQLNWGHSKHHFKQKGVWMIEKTAVISQYGPKHPWKCNLWSNNPAKRFFVRGGSYFLISFLTFARTKCRKVYCKSFRSIYPEIDCVPCRALIKYKEKTLTFATPSQSFPGPKSPDKDNIIYIYKYI